jgi:hypothetical protein
MDSMTITVPPSTVSRQLVIADPTDCTECPIKTFKETGSFYYQVNTDNPTFSDLNSYRVRTLYFDFVGARPNYTSDNEIIKVMIDSSGIFQSKEKGAVYDFVTTPRSLAFEYNIVSGKINRKDVLRASVLSSISFKLIL